MTSRDRLERFGSETDRPESASDPTPIRSKATLDPNGSGPCGALVRMLYNKECLNERECLCHSMSALAFSAILVHSGARDLRNITRAGDIFEFFRNLSLCLTALLNPISVIYIANILSINSLAWGS